MAKKGKEKSPIRHKWPVGWRPGEGKTGTGGHPSVVRDRNPIVRMTLTQGQQWGHTHARFKANPHCCPICANYNGRRHLITTILRWAYQLPHPNCLCTWETETKHGDHIGRLPGGQPSKLRSSELLEPFEQPAHMFRKGGPLKDRPGLVLKQNKAGKRQWMKVGADAVARAGKYTVGDAEKDIKAGAGKVKEKVTKITAKLHDDTKAALNSVVEKLRGMKPGDRAKINGVDVEKHADGKQYSIHGVVAHGHRAASIIAHYFERAAASGGQMSTGSLAAGREMAHGGEGQRTVEKVGSAVAAKAGEVDARSREAQAKSRAKKAQSQRAKAQAEKEAAKGEAEKKTKSDGKKAKAKAIGDKPIVKDDKPKPKAKKIDKKPEPKAEPKKEEKQEAKKEEPKKSEPKEEKKEDKPEPKVKSKPEKKAEPEPKDEEPEEEEEEDDDEEKESSSSSYWDDEDSDEDEEDDDDEFDDDEWDAILEDDDEEEEEEEEEGEEETKPKKKIPAPTK